MMMMTIKIITFNNNGYLQILCTGLIKYEGNSYLGSITFAIFYLKKKSISKNNKHQINI